MRDVRRLLVATDFGPEADFAIAHAGHVARRTGASVDLLHVQRSIAGDDFPDRLSLESAVDLSRREDAVACARARLDEAVARMVAGGIAAEAHVVVDGIADGICNTAERLESDLIVLGTRGRGAIGRWLLGSVAALVTRRAGPAVMAARGELPSRAGYSFIVVPTDFSRAASRAAEFACALLRPGGTLELVHCWEPPSRFGGAPAAQTREEIDTELRQLGASWCEVLAAPDRIVEFRQIHNEPSAAIVNRASAGDCELVAMGTHGYTGLRRLILGSNAEEALRRARCPVLVAHGASA